ncbi:HAD family hydrolase [Bacillus hominis]|uniref:HAD-IIB family hydrolase n=1 Tax=Bacillus hominis TaxID=2817478 RepID=UPI0025A2C920|nr:HAD family hydrolase [Bacillus hominis]MDM5436504.1 HAD family hydrolase [Bacillus hominis]
MSNFPPKIFLFDLDGTIVFDNSNSIPFHLLDILFGIKQYGDYVSIATGRTLLESLEIIKSIKPNLPVICMDGRLIYDFEKQQVISHHSIPQTVIKTIRENFGDSCYIYEETHSHINTQDQTSSLLFNMAFHINRKYLKINNYVSEHPLLRIYLRCNKHKTSFNKNDYLTLKRIANDAHLDVYSPGEKWIVLQASLINKYDGLLKLCKYYSFSLDQVIAFGNGENDIPLFKNVGTSVVMPNSLEDVKRHADILAKPIEGDGIAPVLKFFI